MNEKSFDVPESVSAPGAGPDLESAPAPGTDPEPGSLGRTPDRPNTNIRQALQEILDKMAADKPQVYAEKGKIVCTPGMTAVPLNLIPLLLAEAAAGPDYVIAMVDFMEAVDRAVRKGQLRLYQSSGSLAEVSPTAQYDELTRQKLLVDVENFAEYVRENYPRIVMTGLSQPAKRKWDKYELQKLYDESLEPGATLSSLSQKYGISRQAIKKHLDNAKKLVLRRADPFDSLYNNNRK